MFQIILEIAVVICMVIGGYVNSNTESTNNDIAPFKSLFNDIQSKDNSKKIRSILRNKKKQGLFLGSSPSFGLVAAPPAINKRARPPNTSRIGF